MNYRCCDCKHFREMGFYKGKNKKYIPVVFYCAEYGMQGESTTRDKYVAFPNKDGDCIDYIEKDK